MSGNDSSWVIIKLLRKTVGWHTENTAMSSTTATEFHKAYDLYPYNTQLF